MLDLTITNLGNCDDTFTIEIENIGELTAVGFKIKLSSDKVTILKGLSETVTISVKIPEKNINLLTQDIDMKVTSKNGLLYGNCVNCITYELTINEIDSSGTSYFPYFWPIISMIIILSIIIIVLFWRKNRISA